MSCSKTVKFEPLSKKIRPLETRAAKIILHEDYIFADNNAKELKRYLIQHIQNKMKSKSRFQFEFIPSGEKVPRNNSNNALVFVVGDIWFHQGKTSGDQVKKVTRYKRDRYVSQSWDEIEHRKWDKDQLQNFVSLYFLEIGSDTKILRATLTASNDSKEIIRSRNQQLSNKQFSQFYQDKKLQPAHTIIKADNNITDSDKALNELASKAVNTHFNSL